MKEWLLTEVENSVAKGDIAHFDQFLLLPQCFQKSSAAESSESVCMRERVKIRSFEELWYTCNFVNKFEILLEPDIEQIKLFAHYIQKRSVAEAENCNCFRKSAVYNILEEMYVISISVYWEVVQQFSGEISEEFCCNY